jgi:hypothetical protein
VINLLFYSHKRDLLKSKINEMKTLLALFAVSIISLTLNGKDLSKDVFKTSNGDLEISFVGHGTLLFEFNGMVIHIDPTMREADYLELPDADLILVTHNHGDHLDLTAINHTRKEDCPVVMTQTCIEQLEGFEDAVIMKNGDRKTIKGLDIEAVPAYNIVHVRGNGQAYHPKGIGG